jgi:hypothetical protein
MYKEKENELTNKERIHVLKGWRDSGEKRTAGTH